MSDTAAAAHNITGGGGGLDCVQTERVQRFVGAYRAYSLWSKERRPTRGGADTHPKFGRYIMCRPQNGGSGLARV